MIHFLAANPLMEGLQAIGMLIEEKLRGGQWGSGPPYPGLPNQGVNMQPDGAQPYGAHPYQQPYGAQPYGAYGGYQQPAYGAYPGYGAPAPQAAPAPYGNPSVATGQEVDVMHAQKQYMGRIIGKKGVTINDLQRRSSCDIQVNQDVPHGQECEITIRGTRSGIESAKQMIQEVIDVGPQHPVSLNQVQ